MCSQPHNLQAFDDPPPPLRSTTLKKITEVMDQAVGAGVGTVWVQWTWGVHAPPVPPPPPAPETECHGKCRAWGWWAVWFRKADTHRTLWGHLAPPLQLPQVRPSVPAEYRPDSARPSAVDAPSPTQGWPGAACGRPWGGVGRACVLRMVTAGKGRLSATVGISKYSKCSQFLALFILRKHRFLTFFY